MSHLIVVGFDDQFKASQVLLELTRLQHEHLVDLEDAAVVIRNPEGKIKINQTQDLTLEGAFSGGFWGVLVGLLLFQPLLGWAAGLAAGALAGRFADIGIDDEFIKEVGATITPGTSAIFVLIREVTPDKVLEEVSRFGGKVLRTSLSREDEAKLQDILDKGGKV